MKWFVLTQIAFMSTSAKNFVAKAGAAGKYKKQL